jgi:hypothetical protein
MLALSSYLLADKEAPISPERLTEQSELVVQGKVVSVVRVKEEAIASEKQGLDPVHVEYYEARVDVTAFEKRGKALADYKNRIVLVKFKCVTDPRYKGEVIPKMEKGHTYLIYGRTVRLDADGMAVIFVNSSRELYKIEQTQK